MATAQDLKYTDCYRGSAMSKLAIAKGIIYALIMGTVAVVGIVENGNPTYIVLAFLFGALLIFGVEVNTVRVGDWIKIDFASDDERED
jgi:hypothetical protein